MLENVKREIGKGKEKMVPLSTRVEDSTRMFLEVYAANNKIKLTELTRFILNAFLEEAKKEELDVELIQKAGIIVPYEDEDNVLHLNENPPFKKISFEDYIKIMKPMFITGTLSNIYEDEKEK